MTNLTLDINYELVFVALSYQGCSLLVSWLDFFRGNHSKEGKAWLHRDKISQSEVNMDRVRMN